VADLVRKKPCAYWIHDWCLLTKPVVSCDEAPLQVWQTVHPTGKCEYWLDDESGVYYCGLVTPSEPCDEACMLRECVRLRNYTLMLDSKGNSRMEQDTPKSKTHKDRWAFIESSSRSVKCTFCQATAKWILERGGFHVCEGCRTFIDINSIIQVPIDLLEYNRPRNTEERMLKKAENCEFTIRIYESIRKCGLINPLVVEPRENGRLGVMLGANRLASIKRLRSEAEGLLVWPLVPCIITLDSSIKELKSLRKRYKKIPTGDSNEECLTCKCGKQDWKIYADRLECACGEYYTFSGLGVMVNISIGDLNEQLKRKGASKIETYQP